MASVACDTFVYPLFCIAIILYISFKNLDVLISSDVLGMFNVIYILLQRYKLWLIMIDAYSSVRLMIMSIRLMQGFVVYCGIAIPL
jgi:hypothetical protein